jgi:hypothetical protein
VPTFHPRYEKALRVSAGPAVVAGRLQGAAAVSIADLANAADTRIAKAPYELFGPGDVQRLAGAAITRRFPAPGASDAEETKLALVEFAAMDLPWRYTPAAAVGNVLRPWLVLVVGRRAPDEIVLRPDGRVTLGAATQAAHNLTESWKWAHVHEVDGPTIARIVAPVDLAPETDYVACLVPAYTAAAGDAWSGAAAVTVDCYDRWTFRTGPEGDFQELAAKLHKADLAAIEAAGGKPFGRAAVTYQERTLGAPATILDTAGVLRLPPDPAAGPDPTDAAVPAAVADDVAALTVRIVTPDGRGVVTAPRYEEPFGDADAAAAGAGPVAGGWVDQLRTDPRARGAAGLGSWNAIDWQDRISAAAATRAGDLTIAHDRIRHVALGVEASRSLWRRHLPALPAHPGADPAATDAAAAERLAVLAPVLGRLPSRSGNTVLDDVADRGPQLGRALLSSAARRALRPGPARTALTKDGAGRIGAVLQAAAGCPPETEDPADIRKSAADPEEAIKRAIVEAAGDDQIAGRILEGLGGHPSEGQLAAAFAALAPGPDGKPDERAIEAFRQHEYRDSDVQVETWPGFMRDVVPDPPCRPLDLVRLSNAVAAAVDPTVDRPPAVVRVLSTLPGITHIGPVEIEPELDIPLWSFLSAQSPDWMLPGAGDLKQHEVVGLSTNPAFVEALLVGANGQATAELRWRNLPLVTRWSPLRKFWQRPGGEYDIVPIKQWPDADALGDAALAGGRGAEAVVAFRTSLFRRYPATVVYLYPAAANWQAPAENTVLALPDRKDPTFTGTIGDDITFFGFAVPPSALATHWVVLEEPPAGYRFYHQDSTPPPWPGKPDDNSANFAYNRFAQPVRVLIGPLL